MKSDLYVILGDVISSKKMENRNQFQKNLIEACQTVNQKYGNDIYADFDILKGTDEIGAVLRDVRNFYQIMMDIFDIIGLNVMRFVLVKGDIDTGLDQKQISRMDGPVFHVAVRLMQELKREKLLLKMSTSNEVFDTLVTDTVNLIYLIEKRWSPLKLDIIREYEKSRDQKEVAHKFGIKQQDISYHIKSSNWREIQKIKEDLKTAIKLYSLQGLGDKR